MSPARPLAAVGLCLALPLVHGGCQQPESAFYARAISCDLEAAPESCGTDESHRPMSCFGGALPGGEQPFCAAQCSPGSPPVAGKVCVGAKALLATCNPSRSGASGSTCPDPAMSCYRTDMHKDEGICVLGTVCNDDSACGGKGKICATSLANQIWGASAAIKSDHLHCIQAGCSQARIPCPAGQMCMPDF